jgi:aryl-alcohol dehydrogenase-like predicted oxidoreductase
MTNLMDSAGALRRYAEPAQPRAIIAKAKANGVGVMGIRAVQAGALTAQIDRSLSANHPETKDYDRAAPYRDLCKRIGQDPAVLAHRYAMSMAGVDTVVLGVKNRTELAQCLEGERLGILSAEEMKAIDDLGLRT